ncbi:methyltransferase family protein [Pseudorhodoferax sp.]|uniref:methyltransferase family protein n=1 Tax=Pseudorhodoferax sp. TaxID=1993553 RepID=UPI002DD6199F|nr:isoprenylcysteine carboxylmethyltransferase family protein [Pseudorhodoferax sp.]
MQAFLVRHRIGIWRSLALLFAAALALGQLQWRDSWVSGALVALGILGISAASIGRLWCALYISGRKSTELVTQGPYSVCRHPLYLCNLLGFLGVGALTESLLLTAGLAASFALLYPAVIAAEDGLLRARFGAAFDAYAARTPAFVPRWALYRSAADTVVHVPAFVRNMRDSVWFLLAAIAVEMLDRAQELGWLTGWFALA